MRSNGKWIITYRSAVKFVLQHQADRKLPAENVRRQFPGMNTTLQPRLNTDASGKGLYRRIPDVTSPESGVMQVIVWTNHRWW